MKPGGILKSNISNSKTDINSVNNSNSKTTINTANSNSNNNINNNQINNNNLDNNASLNSNNQINSNRNNNKSVSFLNKNKENTNRGGENKDVINQTSNLSKKDIVGVNNNNSTGNNKNQQNTEPPKKNFFSKNNINVNNDSKNQNSNVDNGDNKQKGIINNDNNKETNSNNNNNNNSMGKQNEKGKENNNHKYNEEEIILSKFNKGNMLVVVRKRPLNQREIEYNSVDLIKVVGDDQITVLDTSFASNPSSKTSMPKNQNFFFDYVFDYNSTQEEVYSKTTKFLLQGVLEGYNATVLAYGATGCGKTYTMVGKDDNEGIMVRSLADLFILKEKAESFGSEIKISMAYVEVYNETILDLMVDKSEAQPLEIYDDSLSNTTIINGVTEIYVNKSNEVFKLLV